METPKDYFVFLDLTPTLDYLCADLECMFLSACQLVTLFSLYRKLDGNGNVRIHIVIPNKWLCLWGVTKFPGLPTLNESWEWDYAWEHSERGVEGVGWGCPPSHGVELLFYSMWNCVIWCILREYSNTYVKTLLLYLIEYRVQIVMWKSAL